MQEGWKCPVCGCGNAPFAPTCGRCVPQPLPLGLGGQHSVVSDQAQAKEYRPNFCSACGCEPCNGTTTGCCESFQRWR